MRKRPGMYVGSTGLAGLHHLIWEVVDNSVDEAMAGYCRCIVVVLQADGGCRVEDDGRGVPVDPYPSGPHKGKSAAEVVLTVLHAGGKFGGGSYKVSGGLHGVGVSVVNALSERLVIEIDKDGSHYRQEYAKGGKPQGRLERVGPTPSRGRTSGTTVAFWPDPDRLQLGGHRVPRPDGARAPADDGLPQQGPGDPVHRRAGRQGAEGHLRLQGRHRRLRQPPERVEGGAVLEGRGLHGRRGRPGDRHRPAVEHGLLRRHPWLRQRHLDHRGRHARGGLQDGADLGRQQVRPIPEPAEGEGRQPPRRGHPGRSRRPSSPSSSRTRSSRARPRPSSATSPPARSCRRSPTRSWPSGSRRTPPRPTASSRRPPPRRRPGSQPRTPATPSGARPPCPAPACRTS